MLRRKLAILVAAAMMLVMMFTTAAPAFAQGQETGDFLSQCMPNTVCRVAVLTLLVPLP